MRSVFAESRKVLERFAGRLVSGMLASQTIPEENAGLVLFGIVQGLRSVIEILMILVTGIILNVFWQTVVLLVVFIPLRSYAGGYHAKTPVQCAVMTWLLFFCFLMWIRFLPEHVWLQLVMLLSAGICLWACCPVQHENKPLEEYEFEKYRKRTRLIYLTEVVLAGILYVAGMTEWSHSIVLGIVMVWLTMMIAVVEKRISFVTNIGRSSLEDPEVAKK